MSHATLKTICTLCNTNTYLHNIHKRGFCVIVGNIVNVIYASTFATKLMKQQLDEIISESAFNYDYCMPLSLWDIKLVHFHFDVMTLLWKRLRNLSNFKTKLYRQDTLKTRDQPAQYSTAQCSGKPLFFPVTVLTNFWSDFCAFGFFRENAMD